MKSLTTTPERRERKPFFFEKKNQKTFGCLERRQPMSAAALRFGKAQASHFRRHDEVLMADPAIFDLAQQRMGWLDARQQVTAQNIANADTPSFVVRDLVPFDQYLAHTTLVPTLTNPLHLAAYTPSVKSARTVPTERAPDGNTVNIEDQLATAADTETQQGLVGNLWKTYMGMFMTALGK
jgi:flagellar basal-body rod protein FlgB